MTQGYKAVKLFYMYMFLHYHRETAIELKTP